jgi:broad specificity phosphatase PhoE
MRSNRFYISAAWRSSITVIRHAESTWNVPLIRIQGQSKDKSICLSEAGRLSVKTGLLASIPKPDILITSPLLRCIQTAEEWFAVPFERIPIKTVIKDDLMEINAGQYEGRWLDELKDDLLWNQWLQQPHLFSGFPNGETLNQFASRLLHCFIDICNEYDHSSKNICIITHGIVMRVLKCYIENQDPTSLWEYNVANLEQIKLSVAHIENLKRNVEYKKHWRNECT